MEKRIKNRVSLINNEVYVEFFYVDGKNEISILVKYFSNMFGGSPTEKIWKKALNWRDEQLELMKKYSTDNIE